MGGVNRKGELVESNGTTKKKKKRRRMPNSEADSNANNSKEMELAGLEIKSSSPLPQEASSIIGEKKRHKRKKDRKTVVSNDCGVGRDQSPVASDDDDGRKRKLGGLMDWSSPGEKRKKSKSASDQGHSNEEPSRINCGSGNRRSRKAKKVSFSDHIEVFPVSPNDDEHDGNGCHLVVGKRYTKEEEQIIKDAIEDSLKARGLGWKDGHMLYDQRNNPQLRECWKEIYASIPWRRPRSVYYRANVLVLEKPKGRWTEEEIEVIKRFRAEHGKRSPWKNLSDALDRHPRHIEKAWQFNRLPNLKKGHWSQEEYQKLFEFVNMDLRMKAFDNNIVDRPMIRENISWTAVSDAVGTRSQIRCCNKWYNQLTSPMVALGLWTDCDDYRLINALMKLDASCVEDVDWDNLVEHRSGDVCRRRWKEMTRHIGGKMEKPFMEQVDLLSTRYCEDMLQYRTGEILTL